MPVTTLPGRAVGADGAFTVGVKEPTDFFSVGDGVALLCDGAVVSAGFSLVLELQAVSEPIPAMAAAPATRATRRDKRDDHIIPTTLSRPAGDGPIIADAGAGVDPLARRAGSPG